MKEGPMFDFEAYIRNIPDFPIKGIQFKDITLLLKEGDVFAAAIDYLYDPFREKEITKIAAIEARGFIFGGALSYKLSLGFIPIRKPGKLPAETVSEAYQLEYGTEKLEIHKDALTPEDRVLLIDDVLATGGTAAAACKLIEKLGARVEGISFLIELLDLKGREKLKKYDLHVLVQF